MTRGYLYKRGKKWWISFYVDRQKHRESSRSLRKTDAERLLRQRTAEAEEGRFIGRDAENVRLEDLRQLVLDDYGANERRTPDRVERAFRKLEGFFGLRCKAVDIRAHRLTAYVNARNGAAATIRQELAYLKRGFGLAIKNELLRPNHKPTFPTIAVDNARQGFLEDAEYHDVIRAMAQVKGGDFLIPVIQTYRLTGWRKQEILGLRWSQIDLDAGVIRLDVRTTKNRDGRTFPFAALPELAQVVKRQRQYTDRVQHRIGAVVPWVFHRNGKPIKNMYYAWRRACAIAGVDGRLLHDFRRTAVRALERAGVSRSVAMQLTGHKTESVYRRYAIMSEADLAEGLAKRASLEQQLGKPSWMVAGKK